MFQNFIFDWSGTLVDDLPPVIEATNYVLAQYGQPAMTRAEFCREFHLPYESFYKERLPEVSLDELEVHFRHAFRNSTLAVSELPYAREQLQWCKQHGKRCFVLSSMDDVAFYRQLKEFGMEEYFEATYPDVLDKRKKIGAILQQHNLPANETVFIGDMVHDIDTARHAGVTAVAVLTGYTDALRLARAEPTMIVPDLQKFRLLLEKTV